jgi:hypothetical protein
MAGTVSVVIADDLDGSPAARAVAVSFAARCYQIDLGKKNRARFRKSPQPPTEPAAGLLSAGTARASRDTRPGPAGRRCVPGPRGRGLRVPERGRISAEAMSR